MTAERSGVRRLRWENAAGWRWQMKGEERVESGESPTFREDKFPFLFWFPHRRAHYLTEKVGT